MTMYCEWALQVGNAWILEDGEIGGACWVPADVDPNADFENTYVAAAVEANPDRSDVVIEGLMELGAVHPEVSHWYLAAVSLVPEARGRGLGQVLLAPVLDMLDDEEVPAYLESSNTRNVPFYERLGFETQHEIRLPDDGPVMTTMWRPPNKRQLLGFFELNELAALGGREPISAAAPVEIGVLHSAAQTAVRDPEIERDLRDRLLAPPGQLDSSPGRAESALAARADAGLSRASLEKVCGTLSQVLNWAVRREIVFRNIASVVELPVSSRPAMAVCQSSRVARAVTRRA